MCLSRDLRRAALLSACALCSLACGLCSLGRAEDSVLLRGPSGRGEQRLRGTIVDYTGEQLVLRRITGQEERYDGSRVMEVTSDWPEPQVAAEKLLAEGRPADALPLLREALAGEQRPWNRRRIVARTIAAYYEAGEVVAAGNAFALLLQSDPQTPDYAVIPLPWLATPPSAAVESQAVNWLRSPVPSVRLLGASWLLATPRRGDATRMLNELARDEDPRVAFLATAQLWRNEVASVTPEQLTQWAALAERMPVNLAAGPHWLLGQAYARGDQAETAALHFLRLPILYPEQRQLAAEGLFSAARQLEVLERREEAARLYQELLTEYARSPLAAEAQRRRDALQATRMP